ncbi:Qat anti-phage system TatD family nuclease QatD [Brevundimonas faecalis]|uniref:Qat anti-phage system TatD family nuclease QatD n=1 Tax=Brevundimonas faecalis TaxID=947378 RepID=UPI003612559B
MSNPALIDFHCHLDLYPDHVQAIADCERERVFTLAVTTTPKAWARNHELTKDTKYVRAALGLHPQLVGQRAQEIGLWEELLPQTRYVGEVGLDAGPRFYRSFEAQKAVFERVLTACARAGDKVLTIHSIRAAKTVLDMLEQHLPARRGTAVMHWFTGSQSEARRAVDLGCYFSVNHEMLASAKHAELVRTLPLDRLLTETDGPFTRSGDRPARPSDVNAAVVQLAQLLGRPQDAVAELLLNNLRSLVTSRA